MTAKDAKTHLRALFHEYIAEADDRIDEDKLFDMIIDAVTKPTREQPLVLQLHIKGTKANKLYNKRDLTDAEARFLDEIDDYRN